MTEQTNKIEPPTQAQIDQQEKKLVTVLATLTATN